MMAPRVSQSVQLPRQVHWLKVIADIVTHAGGLRRKAWRLGREYWIIHRSGMFDRQYYLTENPDVVAAGYDPLWHYLCHGENEGRRPSRTLSHVKLRDLTGQSPCGSSLLAKLVREGPVARSPATTIPPATTTRAGAQTKPAAKVVPQLPIVRITKRPSKRIVVYTAIIDSYDTLQQPEPVSEQADYVCFADAPILKPGIWQIRALDYYHSVPRRMARFAKLHPHIYFPHHEWSLWIDGRVKLRIDPLELVNQFGNDLTTFLHPDRLNPFQEADEVIALGLDDDAVVRQQMARYRAMRFPEDAPLHETNVMLRRHNSDLVVAHSRSWFAEMQSGSVRDQLSFDFAAWRVGLSVGAFGQRPLNVRNDSRFQIRRHVTQMRNAVARTNSPEEPTGHRPILEIENRPASIGKNTPVDIIVCVHNALEDVARCLEAVERTRAEDQRLIVVDDGSDSETKDWLERHMASLRRGGLLVRRETAGGYTVAANAGLNASTAPFVALLNSDTIVSAGWLEKLVAALNSGPCIGLAGPLSNAASYQSVPEVNSPDGGFMVNDLPSRMTVDDMNRLCERIATNVYPRVPILNGFCILIRRSLIEEIGLLDELTFPRGYGEENDYCFRASDSGFSAVIACDTYVYHAKSRSYTTARRNELARVASAALKAKWSEQRVRLAAQTLEEHPWLAAMRQQVAQILLRHEKRPLVVNDT